MSRLQPLPRESLDELETVFETFENRMGFVADSGKIMARRPKILRGLAELAQAILDPEEGEVPSVLKSCIAQIASWATGCLYCQAHFANNALRAGVAAEKLENLWDFEQNEMFNDAERVALRLALTASQVPNGVTDKQFDELRKFWDDGQIVEILATICYAGFLNRWNDSLATGIEEIPAKTAEVHLSATNWQSGKHGE